MAAILKIKRGLTSTSTPTLATGELGYSMGVGTSANGGDRLYIGTGVETAGAAASVVAIGGKYFTDLLGATAGTLTASRALIVDGNKKLDELLVDDLSLNGNVLSSTGTLKLQAGTGNIIELAAANYITGGSFGGSQLILDTGTAAVKQLRGGDVSLIVGTAGSSTASVVLNNDGSLTVPGTIKTLSNGNLTLAPNGTGLVSIANAFTLPRTDGSNGQVLKTDGAGNVTWGTASSASGSVTSVDASGGTTGLTFTGGPITSSGTLTLAGTLAVANGGTGVTTKTGTGSVVLSDSPTLVTPNLGTPTTLVLTSATGLPVATGISGLGTGVATALAAAAGAAGGFVTVGGSLGTPSSITLTNGTGLPVATGISGLGTGVATALAINTGSAGAFLVEGGALGTPSSGTLTNATGLPVATGISGLGANVASFLATPSSSNLAAALTTKTGTGSVVFGTSPTLTTSVIAGGASFDLLNTVATTVNFAGAATALSIGAITGTTTINNDVALKGTTTVSNHILPETDSVYDLGSSAKRFRTIYLKGSTIDLGGATMSGSAVGGITMTSLNGTPVGDVVQSTGKFTTLESTGNAIIGGNLTVNGTLTSINTTAVEVTDKTLELGKTVTPTEVTANGSGIFVTGTSEHSFLYNSTTTSWNSSEHLNIATGKVYAINGVSVLEATTLGSTVVGSSLTSVGILTSGTWSATNIAMNKGGTGASLTAVNGGITYSTGSALAISAAGTSGQFFVSGGAGAPTWTDTIDGGTY
jgi:hypothetical protein